MLLSNLLNKLRFYKIFRRLLVGDTKCLKICPVTLFIANLEIGQLESVWRSP